MTYLDSFAGLEELLSQYQESYRRLRELQRQLGDFLTDEGEKARQLDLLQFQIQEIEEAGVRPGEREELSAQRDKIRNSEKIAEGVSLAKALLTGDEDRGGILSELDQAAAALERVVPFLPEGEACAQKLREAQYALEDADGLLDSLPVEFDPAALDQIEERLDLLYKLGLKYGETEEKILSYLEECREKLHAIQFSDQERERLEGLYEEEKSKSIALAKELSQLRKKASLAFSKRVKEELSFLNMPGMEFQVEIQRVPLTSTGCDKLQFLVSANKGEPPKPMSKIASGGELSGSCWPSRRCSPAKTRWPP